MDAETVIESVADHMDALQDLFSWAILLAFAVAWAGLRDAEEIEIGELSFDRHSAFHVVAGLYFVANLAILAILARLHGLLLQLTGEHYVEAYSSLATHAWILNPFAFVGDSFVPALAAQWGIGLLITSWWICLTSVMVLRGKAGLRSAFAHSVPFYATGIFSLVMFYRLYRFNLSRLEPLAPTVYEGVRATAAGRYVGIGAGTAAGLLLFVLTLTYQQYGRTPVPWRLRSGTRP